jgi:hypothetical protein
MALEYPSKKRDVVELDILSSPNGNRHHGSEKPDSNTTMINQGSGRSSSSIHTISAKNGVDGGNEEVIEYPGPMKLFFITLALCLAVFLVALDQTIIATVRENTKDEVCD